MVHLNKPFSQKDYDECNTIGVNKVIDLFRYIDIKAYQAPNIDKMAHYDVIAEWPIDTGVKKYKVECEVRREHFDDLYNGKFSDVRFPKRKFYTNCDTPYEKEDIPNFIITMDVNINDQRYIIADENSIRYGLPKMYRAWNKETKKEEWFVPISKEFCNRILIEGNEAKIQGFVSDGEVLQDSVFLTNAARKLVL